MLWASLLCPVRAEAQSLSDSEIRQAIAAGGGSTAVNPYVLGYGDRSDPVVVGYVYPPVTRIGLATAEARRQGRSLEVSDLTADVMAALVYVVVPGRMKMTPLSRLEEPAHAERLVILSKTRDVSSRIAADLVELSSVPKVIDVSRDPSCRVFRFALTPGWTDQVFIATFDHQAINTSGDSGREIRWLVIRPH